MTAPSINGDRIGLGIGLGALAYSMFAMHDASNKWLVAFMPAWQVLFCRSLTVTVACLAIGRGRLLTQALATPLKGPLLLRSGLTLLAWLCYYTAARDLPLAQMLTLYFSAPLITMLLAIPILGERITGVRWITAGLGFAGVLVASDPFGVHASTATALVLFAAVLWGIAIILMRQIARRESSLLQMLYQNVTFLVVTGTLTAFSWVMPTGIQWPLLLAIGVLGGLGQFTLFEACRLAPASVMATVEYTALVWGFVLGYLVWGDIPSVAIFAGAGLILASGLLLVVMERRRGKHSQDPPALDPLAEP